MASSDSSSLIVWGGGLIKGIRVDSTGGVLDSAPISLTVSQTTNKVNPRIASDGTFYLVTWREGTNTYPQLIGAPIVNTDRAPVLTLPTPPAGGWKGAEGSEFTVMVTASTSRTIIYSRIHSVHTAPGEIVSPMGVLSWTPDSTRPAVIPLI